MDEDESVAPPLSRREEFVGGLRSLFPYLIAGAVFIVLGVSDPRFMLNWSPGILLLLGIAWGVPALWRRVRAR